MGNNQPGQQGMNPNQNPQMGGNQYPSKENFMNQMQMVINQNSSNNSVTKPQFNRIMSLLGLDLQDINYIPILDGLFEQIEPLNITQAKPKYNVQMFMNRIISDNYFLIECKKYIFFFLNNWK